MASLGVPVPKLETSVHSGDLATRFHVSLSLASWGPHQEMTRAGVGVISKSWIVHLRRLWDWYSCRHAIGRSDCENDCCVFDEPRRGVDEPDIIVVWRRATASLNLIAECRPRRASGSLGPTDGPSTHNRHRACRSPCFGGLQARVPHCRFHFQFLALGQTL